MISIASRWQTCLFALPLLASCGLLPPRKQIVSRPQLIEVPVIAYRQIPDALTAPLLPPPEPPLLCVLNAKASLCVLDALATIPAYQSSLDLCNSDRAKVRMLGKTDAQ